MGFDIFSQHRAELPPPLDPIPGSKYFIAFRPGRKKVEINWTTKATSDWKKILEVIRKFPNREYNAASKKWELPWNLSTQNWLKQSGWPEPVAGDEDKPKPDPRIKQKALIDKIQLDPEGTIIPGLRPYQVDFLKFAQHRHGRVALGDEMGCICGDALVQVNRHKSSKTLKLQDFYEIYHRKQSSKSIYSLKERPWFIRCLHDDGVFRLGEVVDVIQSGIKKCIRLVLEDNRELVLTPDHLVKTTDGWIPAKDSLGVSILCNGSTLCKKCGGTTDIITYPRSKFMGYCRKCMYQERIGKKFKDKEIHEVIHDDGYVYLYGYPLRNYKGCRRNDGIPKHRYVMEQHLGRFLKSSEIVHHIDGNKQNNSIDNLMLLSDSKAHNQYHKCYKHFVFVNPNAIKVVDIQDAGMQMTYDIKVLNHGNFLANKIVVHNCGKTVEALSWMVYANAYPALYVVNAPTKLQWQSAYRKWVGATKKHFPDVEVLYGRKTYELSKDKSYIINWDILAEWVGHYKKDPQTEEYHFVADGPLTRVGFRLLVGDEVQAIGNPDSNRSIAFKALSEIVPHVIGMSGTPAMSKPKQFWPLLSIVEPKHFNNRYRFLYRYCDPQENDHGNKTWDGASNVEELHELLVGCMLRRTKDEVMKDLPPKTVEAVPLEVDKKAMQEYLQEEKEAFSGGTTYSGDDSPRARVAKLLRTAFLLKEKAMYDWLDDFLGSGPKLLLFAWHRDVVDLLCKNLYQWNPSKLYGGMTPTERQEAIDKFINTRSCRLMVANIQAGGVGIDGLQDVASNVAFAEFAHTPNYHRQAIDRLHRGGQTKPVTAYYLVAPGTIDMDAMEVLDSRAKMLDSIMDGKETAGTDLITEILERRGMKTY